MPLYEFECEKCGHQFEELASLNSDATPTCPECGGLSHKLMSTGALHIEAASPLDRKPDAKFHDNMNKAMKRRAVAAAACPGKKNGSCSGCTNC